MLLLSLTILTIAQITSSIKNVSFETNYKQTTISEETLGEVDTYRGDRRVPAIDHSKSIY